MNEKNTLSTVLTMRRESIRPAAALFLLSFLILLVTALAGPSAPLFSRYLGIISAGLFFFISLYLISKAFKHNLARQEQVDGFHKSLSAYLPLFRKILSAASENDFSETPDNPISPELALAEFDDLLQLMNQALGKNRTSSMQNQRISVELARSVNALLETGNIQASGSAEQASSVAEITATMEELARTAAQIAENANKVAKLAEHSDSASQEGSELIHTVIKSIENIDRKMTQILEKTNVLGTQSREIEKISDIIYEIANETHMLALNAAIESVAAGESGKRFSIVAAEVRRLAEISRRNAESIRSTLEQFHDSINTTIFSIEEGSKMTSEINQAAQKIISHLNLIVQAVTQTSESSHEISIATQQQRTASEQIVMTLRDISEVTQDQAMELKKSSQELQKVNQLALNLQINAQQTVVDSALSLGFKIKNLASLPEITSADRRQQQKLFRRISEENSFIELIYSTDRDGKALAFYHCREGEKPNEAIYVGIDLSKRPWFVNSLGAKAPYVSETYTSSYSREDCFTVSISIYNEADEFMGVLGFDINAREWNKICL